MSGLNLNPTQLAHARDIVAAVRKRGLTRRHAVIAIETALTESVLRMYANSNNPASLALPHEAVGNNFGSVGLFQQQVGGARNSTANWGTTAELMDAGISTGKFLNTLVSRGIGGRTNWEAAQSVQVSAFRDGRNYRANDAWAQRIVDHFWDGGVVADARSDESVVTASGNDYVVRAGDTLFAIAARFGVRWHDLADLNQLADPDLIRPGDHLHVPAVPSAGAPHEKPVGGPPRPKPAGQPATTSMTYTVVAGDSLFAIAQKFDTTWQDLAALNHLKDPRVIHPGQLLTVG
jgi:LysM repeat protein